MHLLLFNSQPGTLSFLEYVIQELGWDNKTFIFGFTISRSRYIEVIKPLVCNTNNTFIFQFSEILSSTTDESVIYNNIKSENPDELQKIYRNCMSCRNDCYDSKEECCDSPLKLTSWLGFVRTAVETIIFSLKKVLKKESYGEDTRDRNICKFRRKIHN